MSAITTTPVVGLPQQGGWSQVFTSNHLPLVFVFAVAGDNASNVGRDLLDILEDIEPRSAASLHQTMELLVREAEHKNCRLSVVAGLFADGRSILGAYQGTVLLKRNDKVGRLVQAHNQVAVIEGTWAQDDVFVLSTRQAEQFLGEVQQKLVRGFDVDTIVTSVVPGVHSMKDSSQTALLFVGFGQREATAASDTAEEVGEVEADEAVESDADQAFDTDDQPAQVVSPLVDGPTSRPTSTKRSSGPNRVQQAQQLASRVATGTVQGGKWVWSILVVVGRFMWRATQWGGRMIRQATGQEVYISRRSSRRLMRWVIIGLVMLGLVVAASGWWWQQRRAQRVAAQEQLAPLQQQLDQARSTAETDPIRARETVASIIEDLQVLEGQYQDRALAQAEVVTVLTAAREYYQQISGREEFQSLPQFYDLRTAADDFLTTAAVIDHQDGQAYFVDGQQRQVVILDLASKQQQVVEFSQAENIRQIGITPASLLVLATDLWQVDDDLTDQPAVATDGDRITNSSLMATFGNNVYLYHPDERNIFRLTPSEDNPRQLNDPQSWIQASPNLEYDQISSMVIDGDIWLADGTGQIARMRSGRPQDFAANGVPEPFTSPLELATFEDSQQLYILEADQQRIVILDKESGDFIREIKSSTLATASQIMVAADESQLYVISGSLVYQLDLSSSDE